MRYVFSTTDTTVYRFPTHVNELVLDRSESTVTEVFVVVLVQFVCASFMLIVYSFVLF
jgi:hypothetical protein